MTTREEAVELGRQCAAQRGKIQSLARAGRHPEAGVLAVECVALVERVRAEAGNAMALQQAEQLFRLVASLTRIEAVSYLRALSRSLAEFARCCQQAGQFERASGMFGSAVEAQKILLASKRVHAAGAQEEAPLRHAAGAQQEAPLRHAAGAQQEAPLRHAAGAQQEAPLRHAAGAQRDDADELATAIELIELMSNHTLALARANQLAQAYEVAAEFVELARGRRPRSLPLLTGGLAFMADLAGDLGRPRDAVEHLIEGMRVLGAAIEEGLPGAKDAGTRLATRLRTAITAVEFDLPEDVALLLTTLAPA